MLHCDLLIQFTGLICCLCVLFVRINDDEMHETANIQYFEQVNDIPTGLAYFGITIFC